MKTLRKLGLILVAACLTAGLTASIASVGCSAEDPTSQTTQALGGPCKDGAGIVVTCHYSSTYDTCMDNTASCGAQGGYCQETNWTEFTYCDNNYNCSQDPTRYHTYCTWGGVTFNGVQGCGGTVKDPSAFTHNCIQGPRP